MGAAPTLVTTDALCSAHLQVGAAPTLVTADALCSAHLQVGAAPTLVTADADLEIGATNPPDAVRCRIANQTV